MEIELSIVILSYNAPDFLHLCLDSVHRALVAIPSEIIVIDNASTQAVDKMITTHFPEVIFIQNKKNEGFAKANNKAVKKATGKYICILNPDTVVGETTFIKCLQTAKKQANLGALGVQLIDGSGVFLPESKRNEPTPLVSLSKFLGMWGSQKYPYYSKSINKQDSGNVEVLVGAFMFLKREVYTNANGFDPRFFMYGEDIDLSIRLKKDLKLNNFYLGNEKVIHFKGESGIKDKKYRKRFFEAMRIYYKKHYGNSWCLNIGVQIGTRLLSMIQSFKRQKPHTKAASYDHYYWISNNPQLQHRLKDSTQKPVTGIKLSQLPLQLKTQNCKNNYPSKRCYIFDMESYNYQDVINFINKYPCKNKELNYSFRIRKSYKVIGSVSSSCLGETIYF